MPRLEELLLTYLQLARASERRGQPLVRDKLLLLAGATALELDWAEISAECRTRILRHNPRHLLRRWPDLASAARAESFQTHAAQLRRKYSPEKAEHMLAALAIEPGDGASPGQSVREHAAGLVAALVQRESASLQRSSEAAAIPVPVSAAAPVTAWWPFWLGLVAWAALAALVYLGRGRIGSS